MIVADWRTWNDYTVPRLAQTIFDDKRFDLAPILADALEESGHPDTTLPPQLRAASPVTAVRLLAPIIGGELAAAVGWLENLAAELGPNPEYSYDRSDDDPEYIHSFHYPAQAMDYESLLVYAKEWAEHEEYTTQTGGEHWRNYFYGDVVVDFWKNYQIVTGETVENPESFFSCMC